MPVSLARLVTLAAVLAACAHALLARARLPERVASHYGPSGVPDGWMGRDALLALYVGIVALTAALPLVLAGALPRLPDGLINMPNKDYWLAPERREASLRRAIDQTFWLIAGTAVFLIAMFELLFQANAAGGESGRLNSDSLWLLGAYLAGTAVWVVAFLRGFRRPA